MPKSADLIIAVTSIVTFILLNGFLFGEVLNVFGVHLSPTALVKLATIVIGVSVAIIVPNVFIDDDDNPFMENKMIECCLAMVAIGLVLYGAAIAQVVNL